MPRILVLGTGTGVGKTYVAMRLVQGLAEARPEEDVVGIKPVETGVVDEPDDVSGVYDVETGSPQTRGASGLDTSNARADARIAPARMELDRTPVTGAPTAFASPRSPQSPPKGTDAWVLERVSRGTPIRPHPILAFDEPVSPHLAARREHRTISLSALATAITLHATAIRGWQVIELAGGVFSPLNPGETNLDLARCLEPAIWVVVAADALGVLHDVRATLLAMRGTAREPDHVVLSAARERDASTGTNAAEFPRVGLPKPSAVVKRDDTAASLAPLIRRILTEARHR